MWCQYTIVLTHLQLGRILVLSEWSDFYIIDNLPIAVYAFPMYMLMYMLIFLLQNMKWSTNFRGLIYTHISLTLSLHVSLSFIASGRSSGLHPVLSHSRCMNVRANRLAFDWLYAGVHRSTSLTISSLLLQQCPACLVCLACIVFVMGGRWPYSWRLVGCCCQDLFNIARNILV